MGTAPNIIAVVLAAGQSSRFGAAKQLAAVGGRPMVAHVGAAVCEASPAAVVLVAGHSVAAVRTAAGLPFLLINERYREGLGTSIASAARALGPQADALMFCLGDQPLIPSTHYRALIDAWNGDEASIVATGYAGSVGAPVLFGSDWFARLALLRGDQGAKSLITSAGDQLSVVECDAAVHDVDTPQDLEAVNRYC